MLERKDLVKGQYYRYWYGKDYYHIGKCINSNTTDAIGIWGNTIDLEKSNSFTMDGRFGASSSYELATKEEIEWLDYCIEKGKFIPKKEVKSNSLIGRYLKALINAPFSIGRANKGDYFIILDDLTECKLVKDSSTWAYKERNEKINPEVWELMPAGFCPDEVSNFSTQSFKAGDFVYLEKHFKHNIETEDWSKDLPLNEKLEVISTSTTNKNLWIRFKGYSFEHPACKFKLWEEPKPTIKEKPMETNNEFKVGEYVITKGYSTDYDGRVLKITKISNSYYYYYFEVLDNGYYNKNHNFDDRCILRRAKLEEIPTKDLSNEELLSIAKTYYPIGTKFQPIYGGKSSSIVEENNHLFGQSSSGNVIVVTTDNGDGQMLKNSTAIWSKEKGFAKIISSPNEIKGIKPSVKVSDEIEIGDYIQYEDGYFYTVESNNPVNLIHDDNISRYYCNTLEYLNTVKQFKLIRKANNTTIYEQTGIFPVEEIKSKIKESSKHPKLIPIKVRNLEKLETPIKRTRLKIIKPKLISI